MISATAGYHWDITRTPNRRVLGFVSRKTDAPSICPAPPIGCAGLDIIRYRAKGRGTTVLAAKGFPPGSRRANKTFRLTVRVR